MNLVLCLTPETEARLLEEAAREGKRPETVALEAIEERLGAREAYVARMPLAEWREKVEALAKMEPTGDPGADFSRESIYESRGE